VAEYDHYAWLYCDAGLLLLQYGAQKWCFEGRCQTLGDKPVAIDGQWAEWAAWTECSRSCGAGVSQSERHCNNPQ